MHITSLQNERIKHLVKLRDDRRQRERDHAMLVEGWDEISLALAAGYVPLTLITSPEYAKRPLAAEAAELLSVDKPVFDKLSSRDNPDGWLAVFQTPERPLSSLRVGERPLLIIAESVEKPGNLGAILRTADAAHVDGLLLCDPRVDLYGPNVVRASRGTVFTVPSWRLASTEAYELLKKNGIRILAATPSATVPYTSQDLRGPTAIAVGTEDEGLSDFWMERADVKVQIPMLGKVNSLNVSIATALIVYEALRQRTP